MRYGAPGRDPRSKGCQEIREVLLFLVGETDVEPLLVELDRVARGCSGAVVKIRRAGRRPRKIGPLVLPMSAHSPLIRARPGSVTLKAFPRSGLFGSVHVTAKTGWPETSSGAAGLASVMPISSGAFTEWSPTLGVSWHVPQFPAMEG